MEMFSAGCMISRKLVQARGLHTRVEDRDLKKKKKKRKKRKRGLNPEEPRDSKEVQDESHLTSSN